jgi:hypothetical protein
MALSESEQAESMMAFMKKWSMRAVRKVYEHSESAAGAV